MKSLALFVCFAKMLLFQGESFQVIAFNLMQQQQPRKLSREDKLQLHNNNPRSTLQRSEELQEAKGKASKEKITHVLSAACVYDLPDIAWHDPSLMCRSHLSQSQLSAQNSGQTMTHKLAAYNRTRCSKQEAPRAETSKALLSVLSSGRLASFGGGGQLGGIDGQAVSAKIASSF